MEKDWLGLGIIGFCAVVFVVYLLIRNLKDKKELDKSLSHEFKTEKKFELEDDEEN
jgi:hypothetical protein